MGGREVEGGGVEGGGGKDNNTGGRVTVAPQPAFLSNSVFFSVDEWPSHM